ncbi:hypothetical protein BT96DRAFT_935744 [Gymnopus androsaceus JB14]|uniref:Uncharacterized protein n=1 Tax=Gymnopus androsaceus JB14 TaxID=1447944 RepID=A0A6A4I368_9AGAR|nr:hypothetical protein BT96DRAFT_935744 [Gymnopus androsaceus JB14]
MQTSESRLARKSTGDQLLHVLQASTNFLSNLVTEPVPNNHLPFTNPVPLPSPCNLHLPGHPHLQNRRSLLVRKRSRNGRYTVKTLGKEGCSGDSDNDEEDSEDEGLWEGGKMDKGNDEEMEREWEGVNWSGGLLI